MTNKRYSTEKKLPSERFFGLFFALVHLLITGYGFLKDWPIIFLIATSFICTLFFILACFNPQSLRHLNYCWFQVGLILGKVTGPIVMGLIFFLLITPIAFVSRSIGRDELKLKKRATNSYWIDRNPQGPEAESYKNQF